MRRASIVVLATLGVFCIALPAKADWNQFQHDPEHTGTTSSTSITRPNVGSLTRVWKAKIGVNGEFQYGVTDELAVAGGSVYVGSDDEEIYAIDSADGTIRWPHGPSYCARMSAPAVWRDLVMSSWGPCYETSGGDAAAFRTATGDPVWGTGQEGGYTSFTLCANRALIISNGLVVYSDNQPVLDVLSARTGALLWSFDLPIGSRLAPATDGRSVYVVDGTTLYALSADDGSLLWTADLSDLKGDYDYAVSGQISISDGVVYALMNKGLAAFNPSDGTRFWTRHWDTYRRGIAVHGSRLFVGGASITALDAATGDVLWDRSLHGAGPPIIAGGMVWVSGDAIHALDPATGEDLWKTRPFLLAQRGYFLTPPVVDGDSVYAAVRGSVFAWRLPA